MEIDNNEETQNETKENDDNNKNINNKNKKNLMDIDEPETEPSKGNHYFPFLCTSFVPL